MGCFRNKTVICVGSGPSLTDEDCELVRLSGFKVIAVNSSWMKVPFADILYAGDYNWWRLNIRGITSKAERWTSSQSASTEFDINLFKKVNVEWHSGLRAVELAEYQNAHRVILLGYDYTVANGTHWHGDHKALGNPTAERCMQWRKQMKLLSQQTNIEIINCTRNTALNCFPRAPLEDLLCLQPSLAEKRHKMNLNSTAF